MFKANSMLFLFLGSSLCVSILNIYWLPIEYLLSTSYLSRGVICSGLILTFVWVYVDIHECSRCRPKSDVYFGQAKKRQVFQNTSRRKTEKYSSRCNS